MLYLQKKMVKKILLFWDTQQKKYLKIWSLGMCVCVSLWQYHQMSGRILMGFFNQKQVNWNNSQWSLIKNNVNPKLSK